MLSLTAPTIQHVETAAPQTPSRDDTALIDQIAVVVLTHNRVHLLQQCVENVLLRTSAATREIVIWDNASTDGTADYLQSLVDPRIRVVASEQEHWPERIRPGIQAHDSPLFHRTGRRRRRRTAGVGPDDAPSVLATSGRRLLGCGSRGRSSRSRVPVPASHSPARVHARGGERGEASQRACRWRLCDDVAGAQ